MKLKISFKIINSDFDQEYANEYNWGKESVNNMKYNWSETIIVSSDIDKIEINKSESLHYVDSSNKNKIIDLFFENQTILKCYKDNELFTQYSVSTGLIKKTQEIYQKTTKTKHFYFYFKDNLEIIELKNNIYVLKEDLKII
tara:strand:+ start:127 stop:552 length:426 start_codon:yes stop_codon:yes gene_type:complete